HARGQRRQVIALANAEVVAAEVRVLVEARTVLRHALATPSRLRIRCRDHREREQSKHANNGFLSHTFSDCIGDASAARRKNGPAGMPTGTPELSCNSLISKAGARLASVPPHASEGG